jgi:hypothetical protein
VAVKWGCFLLFLSLVALLVAAVLALPLVNQKLMGIRLELCHLF